MSSQQISWLKPFFSAVIVVSTMLVVVFFKMEVRRVGYVVWKKTKALRLIQEEHQQASVELVKKMRPSRIRQVAESHLRLKSATPGQIIQMSQNKIALKMSR